MISFVERRPSGQNGLFFSVDVRTPTTEDSPASSIVVSGWAMHEKSIISGIRVNSSLGELLRESPAGPLPTNVVERLKRHGVGSLLTDGGKEAVGFSVELGLLEVPLGADLYVAVNLLSQDGTSSSVRVGTISDLPPHTLELHYTEETSPLLLPSLGRSGTTLLMGLLSQHPSILVPGPHPFEFRQLSYLWHAARVLLSPADFANSMHPDSFEIVNRHRIGYDPYNRSEFQAQMATTGVRVWRQATFPNHLVDFLKQEVDGFAAAFRQDPASAPPKYVADKVLVGPLITFITNLYPRSRRVFLVRDFRDVFCSARAFNRKRGSQSFGETASTTDAEWLQRLGMSARHLYRYFQVYRDVSVLVRYEDLVSQTGAELDRILGYLEIDDSPDTIKRLIDRGRTRGRPDDHGTSYDAGSSSGRWRRELTREERDVTRSAFADVLDALGYPID